MGAKRPADCAASPYTFMMEDRERKCQGDFSGEKSTKKLKKGRRGFIDRGDNSGRQTP